MSDIFRKSRGILPSSWLRASASRNHVDWGSIVKYIIISPFSLFSLVVSHAAAASVRIESGDYPVVSGLDTKVCSEGGEAIG